MKNEMKVEGLQSYQNSIADAIHAVSSKERKFNEEETGSVEIGLGG